MNSFSSDDLSFDYVPGPIKKACFDDLLRNDRPVKNYAYGVVNIPRGVWSSDSSCTFLNSNSGEGGLFKTPKKNSSALMKLKNPIKRGKKREISVLLKEKPNLESKKNKVIANKKIAGAKKRKVKKKFNAVPEKIPDFSEFDNYELIVETPKMSELPHLQHQNDWNENVKFSKNPTIVVHQISPDIFATSNEASPTFDNFNLPQNNIDSPAMCFKNLSSIAHTSTPCNYEKKSHNSIFPKHDEADEARLDNTQTSNKYRGIALRNPLCNIKNCVGNVNVPAKAKIESLLPAKFGSVEQFSSNDVNEILPSNVLEVQITNDAKKSQGTVSKECALNPAKEVELVISTEESVPKSPSKELEVVVAEKKFIIERTREVIFSDEESAAIDEVRVIASPGESLQGGETNVTIEETTTTNEPPDSIRNTVADQALSNLTLETEKLNAGVKSNNTYFNYWQKYFNSKPKQKIKEKQFDKSVSVFEDSPLRTSSLVSSDITEKVVKIGVELVPDHVSTDSVPLCPAVVSGQPENSLEIIELAKRLQQCEVIIEPLNLSKHCSSICHTSINVTLEKLTFLDQSCYVENNPSTYKEVWVTFIETTSEEKILKICEQSQVVDINSLMTRKELMTASKIGEGSYAEVFKIKCHSEFVVLKIVPIEGVSPSGDDQLTLDEALSEIIISKEMNSMKNNEYNKASIFIEVKRISYARGKFPSKLLNEWTKFANTRDDALNDDPTNFDINQLYIIFHYAYGGIDLEHFKFSKGSEVISVIKQLSAGLAAAELACKFEHRDLHEGNILVTKTAKKFAEFTLEGQNVKIMTNGCDVKIIDFTLSRLEKDNTPIYKDLDDPTLFTGTGDTQYDVYRAMKFETRENWQSYTPVTNILWLSFLMNRLSERHEKILKKGKCFNTVKSWLKVIERCDSAKDFAYKILTGLRDSSL